MPEKTMLDKLLALADDEIAVADFNYRGGQGLTVSVILKTGGKLNAELSREELERLIGKGQELAAEVGGVE